MYALLPLLLLAQPPQVESKFEQVLPEPPLGKLFGRTDGQGRAIVLLHGLHLHPFSKENVTRPLMRDWQSANSRLVKELVLRGDVFAFAYAQNVAVDAIATGSSLSASIRMLRDMGYSDIVLIGHSAGGLIAREFTEDNPDAGVTKVIQVCSPNAGSSWAHVSKTVRKNQELFLKSLSKEIRRKVLDARKDRVIPLAVQFAAVVGTAGPNGDGIVARESQWSEDLQSQGIPVVAVHELHMTVMRTAKGVEAISKLVTQDLKRWDGPQVAQARKEVLPHGQH
jgi:pimeloyl-ACP methyl ester carboxylesterase